MFSKFLLILLILVFSCTTDIWAQTSRQRQSSEMSGEERITNEQIYRELKIFEARTEERFKAIEERFKAIDLRFEMLDERIDNLYTFMWILAGIFTAMFISFTGLLFWDRRTIIDTAVKKTIEKIDSEGPTKNIIDALRELAKEDKKVAAILKNFNLL